MNKAKFGPAGNSESFTMMGYKSSLKAPEYVCKMGLDVYEYQCGRGVNIGKEKAKELKLEAEKNNVEITLHAPYYISLSSVEESKRMNSVKYILDSAQTVNYMGGNRIVVHSGSCSKMSREEALELAKLTIKEAISTLDEHNLSHIRICPETMGKINQLGTLDEVLELCLIDERMIPCIDFGHLNARTLGGLKTFDDFKIIFDSIENKLGISRLREYHAHFSKIEWTAGGEKKHLTFEDTVFGPDFLPVAELTLQKKCAPVIICESAGTQAEDSIKMKEIYLGRMSK